MPDGRFDFPDSHNHPFRTGMRKRYEQTSCCLPEIISHKINKQTRSFRDSIAFS